MFVMTSSGIKDVIVPLISWRKEDSGQVCQSRNISREESPKLHPFMSKIEVDKPWELLAMHLAFLDKRMGIGNVSVVTDTFTRYSFAFLTRDQKATTVAKMLKKQIFDNYGPPDKGEILPAL